MEKSTLAVTVSPRLTSRHSLDSPSGHVMHDISFFEDVPLSTNQSRSRSNTVHSTLARTMSDPINKQHRVSYSPNPNKESTTVTINVSHPSPTPSLVWDHDHHSQAQSTGTAPPPYSPPLRSSPFRQRPYGTDNKDLLASFEDPLHPRHSKRKLIIAAVLALILLVILPLAIFLGVRRHEDREDRRTGCFMVPGMYVDGSWKDGYQQCP